MALPCTDIFRVVMCQSPLPTQRGNIWPGGVLLLKQRVNLRLRPQAVVLAVKPCNQPSALSSIDHIILYARTCYFLVVARSNLGSSAGAQNGIVRYQTIPTREVTTACEARQGGGLHVKYRLKAARSLASGTHLQPSLWPLVCMPAYAVTVFRSGHVSCQGNRRRWGCQSGDRQSGEGACPDAHLCPSSW